MTSPDESHAFHDDLGNGGSLWYNQAEGMQEKIAARKYFMTPGHRPPTSVDVARLAGVSRTTVSYVLNGTPHQRISEETRGRVLAVARDLNYHVQPSARALRKGQNDAIYLILERPLTLFISAFIGALQKRARETGHTLAVYFNDTTTEEERRDFLGHLFSQRPFGLLTLPGSLASDEIELAKGQGAGPYVSLELHSEDGAVPLWSPEDQPGYLIARHLIERGHQKVGIIAPQNKYLAAVRESRLVDMCSVFSKAQLPCPQIFPIEEITLEEARRIARQLAANPLQLTALYGFNDEYCFHLLRALREQGLRIPEDIALVGSDDTPFCELTTPSLTSVRLDIAGMGRYLIDMLVYLANAEKEHHKPLFESMHPPVLIPRESS